jgi:hypothetical protein
VIHLGPRPYVNPVLVVGVGLLMEACIGNIDAPGSASGDTPAFGASGSEPSGRGGDNAGRASGTDGTKIGGPASGEACPTAGRDASLQPIPRRVRRLSGAEYVKSVKSIFPALTVEVEDPFQGEELAGRYSTDADYLRLPESAVTLLVDQAAVIAREAAGAVVDQLPCLRQASSDSGCSSMAVSSLGAKFFRRPLSADEIAHYQTYHLDAWMQFGSENATKLLIQVFLSAPDFVFRWEQGGADSRLTPYETASAMSYLATQAPPDDRLLGLAKSGMLRDRETIEAEFKRLLAAHDFQAGASFFRDFLLYGGLLVNGEKDEKDFPHYNERLALGLIRDTDALVAEHFKNGRSVIDLLTSKFVMATRDTAVIYGLSSSTLGDRPTKVAVDHRIGLLTQPSFLASHHYSNFNNPTGIGMTIRGDLLCLGVPEEPANIDELVASAPKGETLTRREQLAAHRTAPDCNYCHRLVDPIGLSLESYDALGQYRTTEKGRPVDTSGEFANAGAPLDGTFDGADGLAERLASAPERIQTCLDLNVRSFLGGLAAPEPFGPECTSTAKPALPTLSDAFTKAVADYLLAQRE